LVSALIVLIHPSTRALAASIYDLESGITFNVLDRVEYNPKSGNIALVGHRDAAYKTSTIPYLNYLATLLDNPTPLFSLEWTPDSERRVAALFERLKSTESANKLIDEWGTWIDAAGNVTSTGRTVAALFGIQLSSKSDGSVDQDIDRYDFLSGMFAALNDQRASKMIGAFGKVRRAATNASAEGFASLLAAAEITDEVETAKAAVNAGTLSAEQGLTQNCWAFFSGLDRTFGLGDSPTTKAFDEAVAGGASAGAAMQTGLQEFDRQFQTIYQRARTQLWESRQEVHIPIGEMDPELRDTIRIAPKYLGLDGKSLLAKLLFEVDYFGKHLIHSPELADRIPGYQTLFMFDKTSPSSTMRQLAAAGESTDKTERFWFSIDHVDAARSADGNILLIRDAAIRINNRLRGPDGKDLPNQTPTEYEKLLTSHYDDFAKAFPDLFHNMREAAKLAYAAQWLKTKNRKLKMPAAGRGTWNGPSELPGIIYVVWSPKFFSMVEVTGGADLRVPPVGRAIPVYPQPQAAPSPDSSGLSLTPNPKGDDWNGCNGKVWGSSGCRSPSPYGASNPPLTPSTTTPDTPASISPLSPPGAATNPNAGAGPAPINAGAATTPATTPPPTPAAGPSPTGSGSPQGAPLPPIQGGLGQPVEGVGITQGQLQQMPPPNPKPAKATRAATPPEPIQTAAPQPETPIPQPVVVPPLLPPQPQVMPNLPAISIPNGSNTPTLGRAVTIEPAEQQAAPEPGTSSAGAVRPPANGGGNRQGPGPSSDNGDQGFLRIRPLQPLPADEQFVRINQGEIQFATGEGNLTSPTPDLLLNPWLRDVNAFTRSPDELAREIATLGENDRLVRIARMRGLLLSQLVGLARFSREHRLIIEIRRTNPDSLQYFGDPDVIPKPDFVFRNPLDGSLTEQPRLGFERVHVDFKTAKDGPYSGLVVDNDGLPLMIDGHRVHGDIDLYRVFRVDELGNVRGVDTDSSDWAPNSGLAFQDRINEALNEGLQLRNPKPFVRHGAHYTYNWIEFVDGIDAAQGAAAMSQLRQYLLGRRP